MMNTAAGADFDDREYRSSHGAAPKGRGSWAFVFQVQPGPTAYLNDEIWWAPGAITFGEARKAAKAEAKRRGFSGTIIVCP